MSGAIQRKPAQPWESLSEAQRQVLALIAAQALHVQTLETRNSDRLDFCEVSVWGIREALALAYLAGRLRKRPG